MKQQQQAEMKTVKEAKRYVAGVVMVLIGLGGLGGVGIIGCGGGGGKIVAKGKGVEVREGEVRDLVGDQMKRMEGMDEKNLERTREIMEKRATGMLVGIRLMEQEAKKRGLMKEVEKRMEELKKKQKDSEGKAKESKWVEMSLRNGVLRTVLIENESSKASVSDEEVREYYDKNQTRWERPAGVRLEQLLVRGQEDKHKNLADKARKLIAKGKSFQKAREELLKQKDVKPGDVMVLKTSRYKGRVPKEMAGVFEMKKGELGKVTQTRAGYEIVRIDEELESSLRTFEEVQEQIRRSLIERKKSRSGHELIARLHKEAKVEMMDQKKPVAAPSPPKAKKQK